MNSMCSALAIGQEPVAFLALDFLNARTFRANQRGPVPSFATPHTEPFGFSTVNRGGGCSHRSIRAFLSRGRMTPNQSPASPTASTMPASEGATWIGIIARNLFQ